jgi:hypothetical protein
MRLNTTIPYRSYCSRLVRSGALLKLSSRAFPPLLAVGIAFACETSVVYVCPDGTTRKSIAQCKEIPPRIEHLFVCADGKTKSRAHDCPAVTPKVRYVCSDGAVVDEAQTCARRNITPGGEAAAFDQQQSDRSYAKISMHVGSESCWLHALWAETRRLSGEVKELGNLNHGLLLFMPAVLSSDFATEEIEQLVEFVQSGGVVVFSQPGNSWEDRRAGPSWGGDGGVDPYLTRINRVLAHFGMRAGQAVAIQGGRVAFPKDRRTGILTGVAEFEITTHNPIFGTSHHGRDVVLESSLGQALIVRQNTGRGAVVILPYCPSEKILDGAPFRRNVARWLLSNHSQE